MSAVKHHRLSFVCVNDVYSFDNVDDNSDHPRGGWCRAASKIKQLVNQKKYDNNNTSDQPSVKILGLEEGKLKDAKGVRVIKGNYGMALDPEPTIIPFHKVWHRLQDLKAANKGKLPRVLRSGKLIAIATGTYKGVWRIFSVKNNKSGLAVNMARPDVVPPLKSGTDGHKVNALVSSLINGGITIVSGSYTG